MYIYAVVSTSVEPKRGVSRPTVFLLSCAATGRAVSSNTWWNGSAPPGGFRATSCVFLIFPLCPSMDILGQDSISGCRAGAEATSGVLLTNLESRHSPIRDPGSELQKQGHMTIGHRLFCKEFLCFNTMPRRHMPLLMHNSDTVAVPKVTSRRWWCIESLFP